MIKKEQNKNFWQGKLDLKQLTLVPGGAKTNPSAVWKICKRFVDLPQSEPLPKIHEKVANFAVYVPCKQVLEYGTSAGTLASIIG